MSLQPSGGVVCRQIEASDLLAVADLLHEGFPKRSKAYWQTGLQRLAAHAAPEGRPRFGFMLASEGAPIGVLLLISSDGGDPGRSVRCNVSSWYVRPGFGAYAHFLVLRAIKDGAVTYINVWPAAHTLRTIEAQGFSRAAGGLFVGVPALSPGPPTRVRISSAAERWGKADGMSAWERRLLEDHHDFGCICLWCETSDGGQPFIFRRRRFGPGRLPAAMLIHCPSIERFEASAAPLGRFLAARGLPMILAGSDRSLRGMIGRHFSEKLPIYCKGPQSARGSDLSYTDAAVFGI